MSRPVRLLLPSLLLLACSGAPLPTDLERAQGLERGGDDNAALDAWRLVLLRCREVVKSDASSQRSAKDKNDDCGLAATREAQLLERLERYPEAATAWERVPKVASDERKAARALVRAAEIRLRRLGQTEAAVAIGWRCVARYPDEVPADDALALVVAVERKRAPRPLRDRLDLLARQLARADLGDNAQFAAADVTAVELGDAAGAVTRFDEVGEHFPRSPLLDDSNWRAAELLRKSGDPRGAIARLQRILRTRKDALIVGSYNSLYLDDAQLEVGLLWRDEVHDSARAIAAFTNLVDDYPTSMLRDDALYELARTHRARHTPADPADTSAACAALARLFRDFPDGNRVRVARELATELRCPQGEAGTAKTPQTPKNQN